MIKFFGTRKLITSVVGVGIVISCIFFSIPKAQAQFGGPVSILQDFPALIQNLKKLSLDAILKAASISFSNSLRSLVNQFAYDTATYLGSGGEGQKPVYFTKDFGSWLRDQGANAGGNFIENFAMNAGWQEEADFVKKYGLCSPDLSVSIKISLGLTDFSQYAQGIPQSKCNLKKIFEAGKNEVSLYSQPDYLKNLAITAFDPTSTDIGIASSLFDQYQQNVQDTKTEKELERQEGQGWLNVRELISGNITAPPKTNQLKFENSQDMLKENFWSRTGDILVDATNIFLNQLAITAFNKLINNLSRNTGSDAGGGSSYYSQGSSGGLTEVARQSSSILQVRFNERTDYNILSELSSCPNEANPGPTNCVISQQFVQAIDERLTLAEAIRRGIIDGGKRVGYDEQGNELSYLNGYPYRSLVILRKYTILSVGWEVAAQYIKEHPQETREMTLNDLITCFSGDDSYQGKADNFQWCKGLIDPNWVLKVPKQYCGMEGYGSQLLSIQATPNQKGLCMSVQDNCQTSPEKCLGKTNNQACSSDSDCTGSLYQYCNTSYSREIGVARTNNYCADEQSCIKEDPNGSCAYYGYCTENTRRWIFNQGQDNSCEARNNTCEIFKNDNGQQAAFLENTLNYDNCDAGQVGCKQYALTGPYDAATKKIAWSGSGPQAFFNKNMNDCQASGEGCHQFIRISDDLDTNLIPDGSFEKSVCVSTGGGSGTVSRAVEAEQKAVSIFGSLVKSAYAAAEGDCELQTFTTPINKLAAPNDQWYILVNNGTVNAGIVNTQASDGSQSLYVEGEGGWYSQEGGGSGVIRYSVLPNNFVMEGGHYYTLSARVFVKEGRAYAGFGYSGTDHIESTVLNQWQTLRVTYYKPVGSTVSNYFVAGRTGNTKFYVDSIKLTMGRAATDYSEYGQSNVIYEKLLPNYLAATCYDTGGREPYTLKTNASEECKKFVRQCNDSEVGCQAYTAVASGLTITGKAQTADYCPSSCVGYNTFVQQPNAFNPRQAFNFIPTTARRCSAQAVGCTAFTNLDKVAEGGEAIEYYSALRKCIKPDATRCAAFYTWEGSDESGYQLKVFSLQKDPGSRLGEEPLSTLPTSEESLLCNATVFQKLPTEAGYNYDCRQFYAQDGTVSYHLLEKTISCSDDCHPYRRELTSATSCTAAGGDWDATQNRCLYYAIPGEGKSCAAADAGCSEYTGNIASNTRNVFTPSISTFEDVSDPTFEGWSSRSSITRSNTSLNLGGHSLLGDSFIKSVANNVTQNRSYNLTFLARAATRGGTTIVDSIQMNNDNSEVVGFGGTGTVITEEWKLYSFDLSTLNHNPSGEKIELKFSAQIYLDNVKLTEIPNRYYLIRNSWTTPAECDQDFSGANAPGYMLGCSQYKKSDNRVVNLHSFSDLCSDSSAGCEAMIDTHNSTEPKKKLVNDTNNNGACDTAEKGCIETPADSVINVIYDPSKFCGQEAKGCQRVGRGTTYEGLTTFADAYVINNPDQYTTTVCKAEAVGCSKWTSPAGDAYFKDPGNEVCEWRLKQGTASEFHWYKKRVNRCGGAIAGTVCSSDSECSAPQTCQLVTADIECDISDSKTLGEGGIQNKTVQPSLWAGLCEARNAGCKEYIDPVSKFNANLLPNPGYNPTSALDHYPWIDSGTEAYQKIILNLNTLYIVKGNPAGGGATVKAWIKNCVPTAGVGLNLLQLDSSTNNLITVTETSKTSGEESKEFYLTANSGETAECEIWRDSRIENETVQLREAIVNYQKSQNLDKQTPNGLASYNKGYIIFNERAQQGKNKAALIYNADKTINSEDSVDGTTPMTGTPANANTIIKVQADRICSKWLDCKASIPDPLNQNKQTCLDVALCDKLNAEGKCDHFTNLGTDKNQNIKNLVGVGGIANLTGYSKVGYRQDIIGTGGTLVEENVSAMQDFYNFGNMKQIGGNVSLEANQENSPGDFEIGTTFWTAGSDSNFRVIREPQELQSEQLNSIHHTQTSTGNNNYLPPVGRGYGRLNKNSGGVTEATTTSEPIDLVNNQVYVISAYFYLKTESTTSTRAGIRLFSDSDDMELLSTSGIPKDQWTMKTIAFKTGSATTYNLELFNTTDANFYIDNIKIESALNVRCENKGTEAQLCNNLDPENPDDKRPQFISAICRLFPTSEALGCAQTDASGVRHKGIKGYCLESDPKNLGTCLLWYPIDKVSSEISTEVPPITFNGDVLYCIEAKDQCSASTPQIYCNKFIKVDTSKYWYQRLAPGTNFIMPGSSSIPESPTFFTDRQIDFGDQGGGRTPTITAITDGSREGYYGAHVPATGFDTSTQRLMSISSGSITSYLGYYGNLSRPKCGMTSVWLNNSDGSGNTVSTVIAGQWDVCVSEMARADSDNCDDYRPARPFAFPGGNCGVDNINVDPGNPGFYNRCECREGIDDINTSCWLTRAGNSWIGFNLDEDSDGNETQCKFTCYNRTEKYQIMKTPSDPPAVVRRLFPGLNGWSMYTWNGSSYTSLPFVHPAMPECTGPRPAINMTSGDDYCWIKPLLSNFKINNLTSRVDINGEREITISYDTKTDPQQLPIKEVRFYYGYNDGGGAKSITIQNGGGDNNPRFFSTTYKYSFIDTSLNSLSCATRGNTVSGTGIQCSLADCCVFKPKLEITDNWNKTSTLNFGGYIVVYQQH